MPKVDPLIDGARGLPSATVGRDLAEYRTQAEPGAAPVARAVTGLLLGAACGALALVALARRSEASKDPTSP